MASLPSAFIPPLGPIVSELQFLAKTNLTGWPTQYMVLSGGAAWGWSVMLSLPLLAAGAALLIILLSPLRKY